ncbi:MAG: hypothetical protein KatS3mg023_3932 [Armatimonadota bacterium]|nr:MAG: hypothetical protein KatS3mg023_3932 [Armatimonadota bacterium]
MFIKTQDGDLLNLSMVYLIEIDRYEGLRVWAQRLGEPSVQIAKCNTREEAEAVLAEIQDALTSRGLCKTLMSIPAKEEATS